MELDINGIGLPGYAPSTRLGAASRGAGADSFLSRVEQARTAPQAQDAASLSGGSYEERLSKLRKLHEETDYSGMSKENILHVVRARFNEAFPDYWAIEEGFYNILDEYSIYEKMIPSSEPSLLRF